MNTLRWTQHFTRNSATNYTFPLPQSASADCAPPQAVGASLAVFQLGESGGGTRLMRWHARCDALRHVTGLEDSLRAFIAEEQSHGALLARLLGHLGQPLIQKQWTNHVFRSVRNSFNLEFNMQVLLTAELVAEVYFGLLSERSDHPAIQAVTGKILRDELCHLQFQREFLVERLRLTSALWRWLWRLQFQAIHAATSLVVAWDHRSCLAALGVSPMAFLQRSGACMATFDRRLRSMLALGVDNAVETPAAPAM